MLRSNVVGWMTRDYYELVEAVSTSVRPWMAFDFKTNEGRDVPRGFGDEELN
jgi:hypothetical protein